MFGAMSTEYCGVQEIKIHIASKLLSFEHHMLRQSLQVTIFLFTLDRAACLYESPHELELFASGTFHI